MDIVKLFRQSAALYLRFVFNDKRQHSKECNVSSLSPLFPHGDRLRLQNRPLSQVALGYCIMFFFFPCFLSPVFPRSAFFPASPSSLILVAMQCNGWMSVWQGHLLSCPRGSLQKHCQRHNGPEGSAIYLPGISITHFTSRTLLLKYSNFQQIYKKTQPIL